MTQNRNFVNLFARALLAPMSVASLESSACRFYKAQSATKRIR